MAVTIEIDVPRRGIGTELTEALAAHGLHAELVHSDDRCALHVQFAADERERLVDGAVHAIEAFLSEKMLPLLVQRTEDGVFVRPAGD
jgi:hypothetical protein